MNDREVSVGLSLRNGGFNRGILQSTALVRGFSHSMDDSGRSTSLASRELDRYAGRTRPLVALIQDFGVALVPIAAAGIPAVTGLAAGLGVAAAAGGTLVLAFHGIGDAVSKVNKAAISPTAANIKNARTAMDQLSVAGQHMVETLVALKGSFHDLRNSAQTGLFPGLEKGLLLLEQRLPQIELFVHNMGKSLGELGHQASLSLAGPQWQKFLAFFTDGAPRVASALGLATGHLVHALAELTMGFAPLNSSLLTGVVNVSKAFDTWSTSLSKTQGFQNFLAYLQRTGPMVATLLGHISLALAAIVEAAAPIGEQTLPLLTKVFDAITAIAKSPLGTPLIALYALTRAFGFLDAATKKPLAAMRSLRADIASLGPQSDAAASAQDALAAAQQAAAISAEALANAQAQVALEAKAATTAEAAAAAATAATAAERKAAALAAEAEASAILASAAALEASFAVVEEGAAAAALAEESAALEAQALALAEESAAADAEALALAAEASAKGIEAQAAAAAAAARTTMELGAAQKAAAADALAVSAAQREANSSATRYAATQGRVRSSLLGIGRTSAVLGGFALAQSKIVHQAGLTNTALLGTIGLMAGPWVGAVGAGVGLLVDGFKAVGESGSVATASVETLTQAIDAQSTAIQRQDALKAVALTLNYTTALKAAGLTLGQVTSAAVQGGQALQPVLDQIDNAMARIGQKFAKGPGSNGTSLVDYQAAQKQIDALGKLRTALTDTDSKTAKARHNQEADKAATEAAAEADRNAAAAVDQHTAALASFNRTISESLLGLKALQGLLSLRDAQTASIQAWQDLSKAMKDNGDVWDRTTKKGQDNWSKLDAAVGANLAIVKDLQDRGRQAAAQSWLRKTLDQVQAFVHANPAAKRAAQDLIDLLQKKVSTNVFSNALADLREFGRQTPKAAGVVDALIQKMREARGAGSLREVLHALQAFKGAFPAAADAVQPLIDKLKKVDRTQIKPKITLDDADYLHKFDRVTHGLSSLPDYNKGKVQVKIDTVQAMTSLHTLAAQIGHVDRLKAKPSVDAQTGEAMAHLMALQAYVNSMHGKTITVTTVNATVGKHAGGGMINGAGGPRDDANLALVSNGEYVMQASAVNYYGPGFMHDVNTRRFASGGSGDGSTGKSFLEKALKALMGLSLGPGDTRKLTNEYQQVLKDFHKHGWTKDVQDAAHQLAKDIRQAAKDQKSAIRDAFHGLVFDLTSGAKSIASEIADLRKSLKAAGGVWDEALQNHARRVVELSRDYDRAAERLDKRQQRLDKITEFVGQVTGNFNNSGFGTGQALAGFFAQTRTDTVRANAFSSTLAQLKAMGLNGDAYSQLASSGDLNTAQQLLAGGPGTISQFIQAIAGKTSALGGLGDTAAQGAFGVTVGQQASLVAQTQQTMDHLQKAVDRQEKTLRDLAGLIDNVGTNLPRLTEKGTYDGTYDGVRDAMRGAGRALTRNGAR